MAVSNTTVKQLYAGTGSLTTFAIPFDFKESTEIVVIVRDESVTPATETTQTLGVDYTLTGSPATDVEFVVAPLSTDKVLLIRSNPLTQATSYDENSKFPAESHEDTQDKALRISQELDEVIDRALKMKKTLNGFDPDIPDPVTGTSVLSVNAGLTGLEWRDFTTTDAALATQVEAETGTDNATFLSPLRGYQQNTARLASKVEAEAGTDNSKLMTPLRSQEGFISNSRFENYGLTFASDTSDLTVTLVHDDGSTPSATNPVRIYNRSRTIASTQSEELKHVATSSLVVPAGASCGWANASNANHFLFIYSIYDGTNMELAVAGTHTLNEDALHNTTAIDATSDNMAVLYSTSARTNCSIKLIAMADMTSSSPVTSWQTPDEVRPREHIPYELYLGEWNSTENWGNTTTTAHMWIDKDRMLRMSVRSDVTGTVGAGVYNVIIPSTFPAAVDTSEGYYVDEMTSMGEVVFRDASPVQYFPGRLIYNASNTAYGKYYDENGTTVLLDYIDTGGLTIASGDIIISTFRAKVTLT